MSATYFPLTVRAEDLTSRGTLKCGLRMDHITIEDHGGVMTGAGLGSPYIILHWKGREACIHVGDLLKAYVASFDPTDAERLPASLPDALATLPTTSAAEPPATRAPRRSASRGRSQPKRRR